MTYSDNYNLRTKNVKFNDVADAIDDSLTRSYGGTTTGVVNQYISSPTPSWTSYEPGQLLVLIPHVTNTGASTVNVNGLGAKSIKRAGVDVVTGDLLIGTPTLLVYSGAYFESLIIQNAINRDGTNSPTANLPMGGFKHTGVADATARNQYASLGQVQDRVSAYLGTTAGTSTAFTVTATPTITGLTTGAQYAFKAHAANGAAATLKIDGTAATTIQRQGTALVGNEFKTNDIISVVYDGSNFQIANIATAPLFIDRTNNRVGIGTTSPTQLLSIVAGNAASSIISLRGNNASAANEMVLEHAADGLTSYIYNRANGPMVFGVNNAEAMRITANKSILVGTVNETQDGIGTSEITVRSDRNHLYSGIDSDASTTTNGLLALGTIRAANTAFNYLCCFSSSATDREFNLRGDGTGFCDVTWTGGGADYAEYFEWADGNPNNQDRRGYSVSLIGQKIKIAEIGDTVIGIVSAVPAVLGNAAWNNWVGKYLKDEYNSYIMEDYEVWRWIDENGKEVSYPFDGVPGGVSVPEDKTTVVQQRKKLSPEFDPTLEYIPREQRREWSPIGLMGKLRLRKGQVTDIRWIKLADISDTIEEWLVR